MRPAVRATAKLGVAEPGKGKAKWGKVEKRLAKQRQSPETTSTAKALLRAEMHSKGMALRSKAKARNGGEKPSKGKAMK